MYPLTQKRVSVLEERTLLLMRRAKIYAIPIISKQIRADYLSSPLTSTRSLVRDIWLSYGTSMTYRRTDMNMKDFIKPATYTYTYTYIVQHLLRLKRGKEDNSNTTS